MVWRIGLAASLFVILLAITSKVPVLSEPATKPIRITSYQENVGLGSITFHTAGRATLPAPHIHFLTGARGETLLLADFSNLFYPFAPQSIRAAAGQGIGQFTSQETTVRVVNFGQFQAAPPIFRIIVSAKHNDILKNVSFEARNGQLVISWPTTTNVADVAPVPAPPPTKRLPPETPAQEEQPPPMFIVDAQEPDKTPAQLQLVFSTSQFDRESKGKASGSGVMIEMAPPRQSAPIRDTPLTPEPIETSTSDSSQNKSMELSSNIPKIDIETSRNSADDDDPASPANIVRVRISSKQRFKASAFRLHEPERYVVDFENLPLLSEADVPTAQAGAPFKTMRVGSPDGKPAVGRLVFDLVSHDCSVHSELVNSASQLLLTFNKAGNARVSGPVPAGLQVILDPGHGGSDPGARRNGIEEKELTLSIINTLKQKLEKRGIKVILTRSDDSFVSLEDRVKLTNTIEPNLFLSVHINSLDGESDIHGIETYYQTGQSKPFADTIHDCLVNNLEVPDRYVRKARFYVINHTSVPAVLAEVGFISCKEERERLISYDYQDRIAKALEQGVILYLVKQNQLAQVDPKTANAQAQVHRPY
jgi:N-acetylmuramoyl-L-alanine amidase